MLRKFAIPVLALLAVPAISHAAFEAGDFELTLSGVGAADKGFHSGSAGADVSLGYFATKEIEVGLRQQISYLALRRDNDPRVSSNNWGGRTRAFADYHFDLGAWQPFVGVNGGYNYDAGITDWWSVGPEVGVKYFVNSTTFVYGMVGYDYALNAAHGTRDAHLDNQSNFNYTVGIGFRF